MKNKDRFLQFFSPLICVVALIVTAVCLLVYEDEFLWKVQELNLHLDTPLFFKQQMVVSGGLLTWLGTYFTEFFYHPLLGVSLLCGWWALLIILMKQAFRVPAKWLVLLLIPIAMLLLTCVDMGYWVYYLKLRGHFFVATIGLCALCCTVWGFRLLPNKFFIRPVYVVLSTAVLYPLIGFYALLTALVMGVMEWRLSKTTTLQHAIGSLAAILSIAVIPLIYYRFVFHETSSTNIYWTALPLYRILEEHSAYYIPYYILSAFFVAMAATYGQLCSGQVKHLLKWGTVQVLILGVLVLGVQHFWYRDNNFHKELRMQRYMEQCDWSGILEEAAIQEDEPTRAIVMMKNLALFRLGKQGDMMYHYKTGAKKSNSPLPVSMTQVVGSSIYFFYGMPNYCYRWCLEDGVEYGWRAEYLKYMTRCSMLNGEYRVARKYIDLLKHTRYHRHWAEQQESLLGNDEALRADNTYGPIYHLMDFHDKLSSDQSIVEQFLMYHFVSEASPDKVYLDQAMNAALWTKDIPTFWTIFYHYIKSHPNEHVPTHYQEAAYMYSQLEKNVNLDALPITIDNSVKQTYAAFMELAQQCNARRMTEEQMKEVFYPRFGQTFFFEYFLVRNQKLY